MEMSVIHPKKVPSSFSTEFSPAKRRLKSMILLGLGRRILENLGILTSPLKVKVDDVTCWPRSTNPVS
jgi:hypothetical protein